MRLQGSMHPVKFLSRERSGGLCWPAGLFIIKLFYTFFNFILIKDLLFQE